jgi:hypothetical protein
MDELRLDPEKATLKIKLRNARLSKQIEIIRLNEALLKAGESSATGGSQCAQWYRQTMPVTQKDVWSTDSGDMTQIDPGLTAEEAAATDGWFISPFDQMCMRQQNRGVEIGVFTPEATWIVGTFEYGVQVKKQVCMMMRCNILDLRVTWHGEDINDTDTLKNFKLTTNKYDHELGISKVMTDGAVLVVQYDLAWRFSLDQSSRITGAYQISPGSQLQVQASTYDRSVNEEHAPARALIPFIPVKEDLWNAIPQEWRQKSDNTEDSTPSVGGSVPAKRLKRGRSKSKARRRPASTAVNVLPVEASSSTSSEPPPVRNPKSPESPEQSSTMCVLPLHAMDCVGIDTDSGKSISTLRKDFMFLDTGVSARNSVEIRGIGGAGAYRIGGRGPMIIRVLTHTGEEVQLVDPEGVYLQKTAPSPDFRVLGQQRMKSFGCRLVQCYNDSDMDVIECMRTKTIVPLATKNGILVVRTYGPFTPVSKEVCLDIVNKSSSALISLNEKTPATSMVMNTARLSNEALARLWHWRLGHPAPEVPLKMQQGVDFRLNEDCYCCDKSKFKVGSFPRRDPVLLQNNPPFWRVYCDAYGGGTREQLAGTSMGGESYEGAVGGYVFTDPTTGTMRRKLYATKEQFPAILFQYLQDVERQHFKCREVYVDTHIINISTAVEDVAAMFLCKVCPISAGTPQELAFAESAVRILGKISRSLLLGAPHLPQWAWGLADGYATYVHDVLPQRSKGNKSPFELRVGRAPDCDALFIKTFGAPLQYAPLEGAEHKRGTITLPGWFLGMQWPFVLCGTRVDNWKDCKVYNVSRKKVRVYESKYANFDPSSDNAPTFKNSEINVEGEYVSLPENVPDDESHDEPDDVILSKDDDTDTSPPTHVTSIKSLHSQTLNRELNEPEINVTASQTTRSAEQYGSRGEGIHLPEHSALQKTSTLSDLEALRVNTLKMKLSPIRKILLQAINKASTHVSDTFPARGKLKSGKRKGTTLNKDTPSSAKRISKSVVSDSKSEMKSVTPRPKKKKTHLKVGMRVSIPTTAFDGDVVGSWSHGRPPKTFGIFLGPRKNGLAMVLWDNDKSVDLSMCPRIVDLTHAPSKTSVISMMLMLEIGSIPSFKPTDQTGAWPQSFVEALILSDWRDWVAAVKKEIDGWNDNNTTTEVKVEDMEQGASIIPLGELFSRKRTGLAKFRQYAMGNLLKAGKDYLDTFSTSVSADVFRWFCSLACACGRPIYGWDATTGYLQAKQRTPVYAFLPTHHKFSNLSYEDLAVLRQELLELVKKEGPDAVKKIARRLKRETRSNPRTVLQINSAVYGIPDAGQAFAMLMQALHIKHCGLTQCQFDPSVYFRYDLDDSGATMDYIFVITWTDDVRYFGTPNLVSKYEADVTEHMKCKMEGLSTEFVGISMKHSIEDGTLELTQSKYWVDAVVRFREYYPESGLKNRQVPMTIADHVLLVEPTDDEVKKASIFLSRNYLVSFNFQLHSPSWKCVSRFPHCHVSEESGG